MNILLWVIQVLIAGQSVAGALWRCTNYEMASEKIASVKALPVEAWMAIGALEIVLAMGLLLPGIFKVKPRLTQLAASALVVELVLVAAFHAYYGVYDAALWCLVSALLSAFVAYGRSRSWK